MLMLQYLRLQNNRSVVHIKKTDEIEKSLILAMEQFEIIDCHDSFFRRADNNTMLLIVSNLGYSDISNATVTIDLAALGLSQMTTGTMWPYGLPSQSVSVSNGTVTIGSLPKCTPRLVLIE